MINGLEGTTYNFSNGLYVINADNITSTTYENIIPYQDILYLQGLTGNIQEQINNISVIGEIGPTGPIGPIGLSLNYRGDWNTSTNYVLNDVVSYQGSSYICILNNINNIPTNTLYFNLIAQKGDQGPQGGQGPAGGEGPRGERGPRGEQGEAGTDGSLLVAGAVAVALLPITASIESNTLAIGLNSKAIATLQTEVSGISTDLTKAESEITGLSTDLETVEGKTTYITVEGTSTNIEGGLNVGSIETDSITTIGTITGNSNLNFTSSIVNMATSLGNDEINIGSGVSSINLNGIVYSPYNFSVTGFFNQL